VILSLCPAKNPICSKISETENIPPVKSKKTLEIDHPVVVLL
jgi:hypothetical protein